jgi:hypothetical protein
MYVYIHRIKEELDCNSIEIKRNNKTRSKGYPCKVLAVVESKINPDDIGEAFLGYHNSLIWLSGMK